MTNRPGRISLVVALVLWLGSTGRVVSGFAPQKHHHHVARTSQGQGRRLPRPSTLWQETTQNEQQEEISEIEGYLADVYPSFYNLMLCQAVDVLKELRRPNVVFTIFAPNDEVFAALGDKRIQQLRDPRNLETTSKMAAFHCVVDDAQVVTAEEILDENSNIGGVLTLAGEVPIGPSESGGFMGMGAKPDGGIVVGPGARVVQSINGPGGVVHEVDALVCPNIIWRYMDQLRLPGL